jgi:alkylation response protein AidB-like acyl-CoA dehydrogenase
MSLSDDAEAMVAALARTPDWARVPGAPDDATLRAILHEAAGIAETLIAPLDAEADRIGARVVEGAVRVPPGYHAAFDALAHGGWAGLEHPETFGGMGLPLAAFAAVNPLFERACPAFMMAIGGTRSAALLLAEWAEPGLRDDWVPALIAGERTATICISEPGAGSDVGRIRTRATQEGGQWRVSGEKIWISFGDHDLRERIGHCLLARTNDQPGTRGLSLFLVERGPGVTLQRIEEKLGLHGSPTCALAFDAAPARLIGAEGRGLPQLFTMIRHMRLTVGTQGLGTALKCLHAARAHALERRQGGDPKAPPPPIAAHPDVQRQLLGMKTRIDLFRLALLQVACSADLSASDPESARLTAWLLPLVKNAGAELAFDVAAQSILTLGGAGFTRDTVPQQALRDARVFAIYEGTTGMQGQDFFLRQTLGDGGQAAAIFLARARAEAAGQPAVLAVLDDFAALLERTGADPDRNRQSWRADAMLRAGWVAVQAWMAARLPGTPEARHFLATAGAQLALHAAAAEAEPA